jgi:hypothetical protein
MPNSSEDRSNDPISAETPSVGRSEGSESEPASSTPPPPAERVSEGNDSQSRMADSGDAPRPPRRRRRRRRPTRGVDPANAAPQVPTEQPPMAPDEPSGEAMPAAPSPAGSEPRRRRRRRRGPRRDAGSAEAVGGAAQAAESTAEASPNVTSPSDSKPQQDQPTGQIHSRRRRRRPPRPPAAGAEGTDTTVTASAAGHTPAASPRYRSAPYGGSRSRGPGNRPAGDDRSRETRPTGDNRGSPGGRARGRGARGPDNRRQGGDRDTSSKRPEPRLYALESVVDRGFEDVVDATEDSLNRRVHWTIIKRTVADQGSGKPISATYVLQRDGIDTEFPGLAAARAAANKTIVHPEKLTLSKAEHAAAKK